VQWAGSSCAPVIAAVETYLRAAIIGYDHAVAIFGIDPQVMVIAMRRSIYI
jgi:hypothetical protein